MTWLSTVARGSRTNTKNKVEREREREREIDKQVEGNKSYTISRGASSTRVTSFKKVKGYGYVVGQGTLTFLFLINSAEARFASLRG